MLTKEIVIIGGSIAGCALGVLLQKLGIDFVILERATCLINQGAGIMLPESLIKQCIDLDLLDETMPRIPINERIFERKNENGQSTAFWSQEINVQALNWMHIYENLSKRLNKKHYHLQTEARAITQENELFTIKTSKETYQTDFIIGADGINSFVRTQLIPQAKPNYAGYIVWRGLLNEAEVVNIDLFEKHMFYYLFQGGHALFYKIPDKEAGQSLLNWVLYENCQDKQLSDLLIDKMGKKHKQSLPRGYLSPEQIDYIKKLAKATLPVPAAKLVDKTAEPFIQAIFDFKLPPYNNNQFIFVGDAAVTLRPHSGSGALKALTDAIKFYQLINKSGSKKLNNITIEEWKNYQTHLATQETARAKKMGEVLVTNPPDWSLMNHEKTEKWWADLMVEKNWYATKLK
ncbi:monooxygenase, FAD-binding [Legionella busanensis]|uniref:Monooxygenase, FAD-binding n=1 Tax=Legionella busanensis TaxID=190655 RepID=A0A378JKV0_9GAMM|nr:FAD-dependent monooxygenase [Legionella busanensis]STX50740.1 monooxygenase, FAD-binding [Legionella busanensis]